MPTYAKCRIRSDFVKQGVSSNPTHVTIESPLSRKASGSHLMNSTSQKNSDTCLLFLLRLKSSMQWSIFIRTGDFFKC